MAKEYAGDAELVERFQNGDVNAFNEIDCLYRPRLVRFVFQRLKSMDVTEEIVQETLMRAFKTLHSLQGRDYLSPWLYKIAHNYCVDWQRRNWFSSMKTFSYDETEMCERDRGDCQHDAFFTGNEKRPNGSVFYTDTPESKCESSEEYKNVWRIALKILTREEYLILWMKYVEEASDEEIAERIGKKVGTLRVSLTRIRKKLYNRLKSN